MKKLDKYRPLVGKKFGKLLFAELIEIKSEKNRIRLEMRFTCECGSDKVYTSHNASKIFNGETVSCGCVRKLKWAIAYHSWKVQQEKENQE